MKLIALRCPTCGQPLTPEEDEVILWCAQCLTALAIDDNGLTPITAHYGTLSSDRSLSSWKPVWVFDGQVVLTARETQGGNATKEAQQFWSQPRRLFVPAWSLSLDKVCQLGADWLQNQPALREAPVKTGIKISPAVLSAPEALKVLDFIVLSIEAKRKDWLKTISFEVKVGAPQLWVLPAETA